ncbi:MAG: sialidase family protein [Terriglobales bacterium]
MAFKPRHSRGRYRLGVCLLIGLLQFTFLVPNLLASDTNFTAPARVGFPVGDQWEPAIAADGVGHVYVLYAQYGGIPGCASCAVPSMVLVISADNGATWQPPREIAPPESGEFDPQIVVDPADQRTVYAAWLQNDKKDTVVAKSSDFGQSWSVVVADHSTTEADKPALAVRGNDVYVGLSRARKILVAASHDGGLTFNSTAITASSRFAEALAGGATVLPQGGVFVSWTGYPQNDGISGRANLYVSQSSDGGVTWKSTLMDLSGAPPDCSAAHCESGYLGAQITIASDTVGALYALWNSGKMDKGPERIYFSSSVDGGSKWTEKLDVSDAPAGVEHSFPALAAAADGEVRIAWMDLRNEPDWNTFYRSSSDGGGTWRGQKQLSSYVKGYPYVHENGFSFPFGDYFQIAIDNMGQTQAVWGEGQNYRSPGSIWYSTGR